MSGKPFGQFLKERILDPLGMTHSAFEPGPEVTGQTKGYTSFALGPLEPAEPEARGWLYAAGGLWASAPDLARWDLALMEGRVLKPASYRLMTTPRPLKSGHTTGYGCGLNVRQIDGETVLSHGGAVSGFLSANALVPRHESAVILLTNTEHLPADALHSTILRLLLEDQKNGQARRAQGERAVAQGSRPRLPAPDAGRQGRPRQAGRRIQLILTDERLRAAAPGSRPWVSPKRSRSPACPSAGAWRSPRSASSSRRPRWADALPDARRQNPAVLDPQAVIKSDMFRLRVRS